MSNDTGRLVALIAIAALAIWTVKDMDLNKHRILAKVAMGMAIIRGFAFFIFDVLELFPQ